MKKKNTVSLNFREVLDVNHKSKPNINIEVFLFFSPPKHRPTKPKLFISPALLMLQFKIFRVHKSSIQTSYTQRKGTKGRRVRLQATFR